MEHLGAGELAVAHLIEGEDGRLEPLPVGSYRAGEVLDDDLVSIGRDDPWIHAPLPLRRLQWAPGPKPGRLGCRLELLSHRLLAGDPFVSVGERGRVMQLDVVVVELEQRLSVSFLNCAEYREYDFCVAMHASTPTSRMGPGQGPPDVGGL
jgi:hypothetical protein